MAVGNQDSADFGPSVALHQIVIVRNNEIDPEHIILREHNAGIDDEDIIPIFDDGHILADLAKPS